MTEAQPFTTEELKSLGVGLSTGDFVMGAPAQSAIAPLHDRSRVVATLRAQSARIAELETLIREEAIPSLMTRSYYHQGDMIVAMGAAAKLRAAVGEKGGA